MVTQKLFSKLALSLLFFLLLTIHFAYAGIFINGKLQNYTEYKILEKYSVSSIMDTNNNIFTYTATYTLSKVSSLSLKNKYTFEARCTRFENTDPIYIFKDIISKPVESTEECSQLLLTINRLMDSGLNPRLLLNHKNGNFLVFRE